MRSAGGSSRKTARRPTFNVDGIELGVGGSAHIEDQASTVGGPARRANLRSAKGSELQRIGSVAVAHPDFRASGAPGLKSDVLAVGREASAAIATAGSDQFGGRARGFCLTRQLELPDAGGMPDLGVGDSIAV